MGHQEHEQIYLSLSRKELQGLCKQLGLPANRRNIDLARALESHFRRTNLSSSSSEEVLDVLPSSEPKSKDQNNYFRETDKDFGREYIARKNSSKAGSYRRIACLKGSVSRDSREFQSASQMENDSQVNNQTSDKAFDRVAGVVSACPFSNGTTEDNGCSTSVPGTSGLQHCVTDVQDIASCPQLGLQCHEVCNQNRSEKLSEMENTSHILQSSVATGGGIFSLPPAPSRAKKFGECCQGSGIISPNTISSTVPTAFQFFVASEDGVNLFVDLCSNPSNWIKSIKDEVCISEESYYKKFLTLCHEIRCVGDATKNLKTLSTEVIETDSQLKGSGGSFSCANSSLNSIGEFCNSVAHRTNNDTPISSILTSNRSPVGPCGHLDEGSQVVSSSCSAYSVVKDLMLSEMLPYSGAVETLPQNGDGNSSLLEKGNASPITVSLSKSSFHLKINLETDRLQKLDKLEHQTVGAGTVYSDHMGEGLLGHMSESASEKSCLSLSSERCDISRSADACIHENHSGRCQLSLSSNSKEVKSLEVSDQHRAKSTACQAHARQKSACLVNDIQPEESELTNHILDQHACANHGSPVPKVPASTSDKELERCIPLEEKDIAEYPHSTKLLVKTGKRSHISEHEDIQSKRQHTNGENQNVAAMNLRSTKSHLKESNCDPLVLPRRSIRLMSK